MGKVWLLSPRACAGGKPDLGRSSLTEAGEESNVQSKRLIKVKDEWFQADLEKQIPVL